VTELLDMNIEDRWEEVFEKDYLNNAQSFQFLLSPPGAGKSFLVEHSAALKQRRIFDCSNDELIDKAIYAALSERFPTQAPGWTLIADEFHMLSREHKEQLFVWISSRLSWLKVILIGNRADCKCNREWKVMIVLGDSTMVFFFAAFDMTLVDKLKNTSNLFVRTYTVRLRVEKLLEIAPTNNKRVENLVRKWCSSTRALFSGTHFAAL
jgi:hypothetical protein